MYSQISLICTSDNRFCHHLHHFLLKGICTNMFISINQKPLCPYFSIHALFVYYSETSLIQHSMGPENNVGLGGCWIMECLLPYLCMVTVPHIMVGLERMLDYRGVGLARFHCIV